jgi:hypothetical protein
MAMMRNAALLWALVAQVAVQDALQPVQLGWGAGTG